MSKLREQLKDYLSQIDVSGQIVLDVGCGDPKYWAQNFVRGRARVYHTLDIESKFNPTFVLDLNRLHEPGTSWVALPRPNEYDTIFALEVFEHLWDPVTALKNVYIWLKVGGCFYFSTPFINPLHERSGTDMLRMTHEWWQTALSEVGFSSVEIVLRRATAGRALLQQFYRAEGLRMSRVRSEDADKIDMIGVMGKAMRAQ